MEASFWAKIEAKKKYRHSWEAGSIECRKLKPATKANEVAVKITVVIPDAYFETPELSARITVPEDAVNRPVITPEIQSNMAELISQQLGIKVHVSADAEQPDE